MEFSGHPRSKKLTEADVEGGRFVVPTAWVAAFMLPAQRDRSIPIRVLDDKHEVYEFYLSVRRNGALKPVFQAREWKRFIQIRNAQVGDEIYFWYEVNELKKIQYRIQLLTDYFRQPTPRSFIDLS